MADGLTNEVTVKRAYYLSAQPLNTRIDAWKNLGTAEKSYPTALGDLIDQRLNGKQNLNILDVGCGTGHLIQHLSKRFAFSSITGVDISAEMIRQSTARLEKLSCEKRFLEADVGKLPFATATFDIVICSFVLHHVEDKMKALKEIKRVAKQGAIIIVATGLYEPSDGLNRIHYQALEKLSFPPFMHDTSTYLAFSGINAQKNVEQVFSQVDKHQYHNDLLFHKIKDALDYYTSAMMMRNSNGWEDHRIRPKQWSALKKRVKQCIEEEIESTGLLRHRGTIDIYIAQKDNNDLHHSITQQINTYCDMHYQKVKHLAVTRAMLATNNKRCVDISFSTLRKLQEAENLESFLVQLRKQGYDGVSLGLTPMFEEVNYLMAKRVAKTVPILAFHGTSIKKAISDGVDYVDLLAKDRAIAASFCTDIPINYDLFAGQQSIPGLGYKETREMNVQTTAKKLKINAEDDIAIATHIIKELKKAYSTLVTPITLELPGAKGTSGTCEFSPQTMDLILQQIDELAHFSLCIDLGHLLTWHISKESVQVPQKVLQTLKSYSGKISTVHISSASSYDKDFARAYRQFYGRPDWHNQALDLMLPIDEPQMIDLLAILRGERTTLLEVCESRDYSTMARDYFEGIELDFDCSRYQAELLNQARVLGYTASRPRKIGLVGLGRIHHKHIAAINDSPDTVLFALCDSNPKKLFKPLPWVKMYTDYNKMLQDDDIDTVDICTPSNLHSGMAIDAARKGKDCLVEKPLALSSKEARAVVKIFSEENRKLCVAFQNRYNNAVKRVKNALCVGELTPPHIVAIVVRWFRTEQYYADWHGKKKEDGGLLFNQGIHFIDLLIHLTQQQPVEVFAYGRTFSHDIDFEDAIVATLTLPSGSIGTIEISTIAYPKNSEGSCSLIGDNATIKIGGCALNTIDQWMGSAETTHNSEDKGNDDIYGSGHRKLIDAFGKSFYEPTCYPTGEESIAVIEVIEAIYRSLEQRKPVGLNNE